MEENGNWYYFFLVRIAFVAAVALQRNGLADIGAGRAKIRGVRRR